MSTITIIQVILFAGYAGYIWKRYGVLSSISASSYRLQGNARYLFSGWLIALAITTFWQDMSVWGHLMAVGFAVAMAAGTFLFYLIRRNWIWWTEILAMGLIATGYAMR